MSNTFKNFGADPQFYLQPDVVISDNGYGLLQLQANFKSDSSTLSDAAVIFRRGNPLAVTNGDQLGQQMAYESWTCVRSEIRGEAGNIVTVSGHFAAVARLVGATTTETEATITSAVVSEPIESHPNFTQIQVEKIGDGDPLGGTWVGNRPPNPDEKSSLGKNLNKFRAQWAPMTTTSVGVVQYNFMAFLPSLTKDPETNARKANRKAGVRSWMRPSVTMRLTGYTIDANLAAETARKTWWVVKDSVGVLSIPDAYKSIAVDDLGVVSYDVGSSRNERNWLVTATNMEVYGGLYKVTADLLLSGVVGWDPDIYPYGY